MLFEKLMYTHDKFSHLGVKTSYKAPFRWIILEYVVCRAQWNVKIVCYKPSFHLLSGFPRDVWLNFRWHFPSPSIEPHLDWSFRNLRVLLLYFKMVDENVSFFAYFSNIPDADVSFRVLSSQARSGSVPMQFGGGFLKDPFT